MKTDYRPDIDGLRAIAVLSVIAFHVFPSVLPGGFVGVDIFFVISGFLITRILVQDFSTQRSGLLAFYGRRVLRIFPALVLVLLCCLAFGWHTLLANEYKQLGKHTLAGAGFVSNIILWFEAGYFDNASETKPLLHLWSLGIEEQFYIVWPLLLWTAVKLRLHLIKLIAALITLSFLVATWLVVDDRTQAFYTPWSRAWELLAGAALASATDSALLQKWHDRWPPLRNWTGMAGLACIAAACLWVNSRMPFPGPLAVLPVAGAVLVIASRNTSTTAFRWLSHPWMVGIGLISYPLYLWHWPLISFATIVHNGTPDLPTRLAVVAGSLVLATATYWLIEKPVRKMPRRWAIGLLTVLMGVMALVGYNIDSRDGLERIRYKRMIALSDAAQSDFADFETTGLIPKIDCAQPFVFPERKFCLTHQPGKPPTVALIGDSHAFHAYWGLSQVLAERGENLILLGKGACVPFVGYIRGHDEDKCQPHMTRMLQMVADSPTIRELIIVFRGRYLGQTSSPKEIAHFQAHSYQTFQLLSKAGKKVTYLLPIAEPGVDPRLCLGQLPMGRSAPTDCSISKTRNETQSRVIRQSMHEELQRFANTRILDPNEALCHEPTCPIVVGGHSLFKDENHLSYSGSIQIARGLYSSK